MIDWCINQGFNYKFKKFSIAPSLPPHGQKSGNGPDRYLLIIYKVTALLDILVSHNFISLSLSALCFHRSGCVPLVCYASSVLHGLSAAMMWRCHTPRHSRARRVASASVTLGKSRSSGDEQSESLQFAERVIVSGIGNYHHQNQRNQHLPPTFSKSEPC